MIEPYKFEAHNPVRKKGIQHLVCCRCGLVYLKNPLTKWCIKTGCNNEYHPQYKKKLKELSK